MLGPFCALVGRKKSLFNDACQRIGFFRFVAQGCRRGCGRPAAVWSGDQKSAGPRANRVAPRYKIKNHLIARRKCCQGSESCTVSPHHRCRHPVRQRLNRKRRIEPAWIHQQTSIGDVHVRHAVDTSATIRDRRVGIVSHAATAELMG